MGLPVVMAASAVSSVVTFAKSPRYGGGDGPLYTTVNEFLTRVASGDLAVIRQLDQLRKTDADKVQWQLLWDRHVPLQPLTDAQRQLIVQLDPSKAGVLPPARYGPPVLANPGEAPPDPLTLATAPLREGVAAAEQAIREGLAGSIERTAVGGGAAAARVARGEAGVLDQVIAFAQAPTGGLIVGLGAMALVVVGLFWLVNRR